jgi:hypothetical protein
MMMMMIIIIIIVIVVIYSLILFLLRNTINSSFRSNCNFYQPGVDLKFLHFHDISNANLVNPVS